MYRDVTSKVTHKVFNGKLLKSCNFMKKSFVSLMCDGISSLLEG